MLAEEASQVVLCYAILLLICVGCCDQIIHTSS